MQFQLNEIRELNRDAARRVAIDRLPRSLPETYKRILDRVNDPDNVEIGRRALAWLLYSLRPLRLSHLATAASIDPGFPFNSEQRLGEDENISDICGSLIKINIETKVVELSHISVKQFLTACQLPGGEKNPYYLDEVDGNALLMKACFMYLASPSFSIPLTHYRTAKIVSKELRLRFKDKFLFYAVLEWVKHAIEVRKKQTDCLAAVYTFLQSPSFLSWREIWELKALHRYQWWEKNESSEDIWSRGSEMIVCEIQSARRNSPGSPLYYASQFGFETVVEQLLREEVNKPNEYGGPESYPLHVALENGNMIVARLLLERGADINAKHKESTALHRAIEKGDYEVAQLLVDEGADTAAHNLRGITPLHLALRECTKNEVDAAPYITLLASNINVKDSHGKIPLHLAAILGCVSYVSMLVQHGADVNVLDNSGRNPLHFAARNGDVPTVDLLLQTGCESMVADHLGYTPLHQAIRSGNSMLVQQLSVANGYDLMNQLSGRVLSHPYQ